MSNIFSDFQPEKVVTPTCAEEVQEIIIKANKTKTPLVPVSSGTNLQGTHLPSVKGATAVDLSQMKGIHFDELNRNAIVEPGVTFADLAAKCTGTDLRALTAIDVPAEASVLATYLEMMPLYAWPKYHPWEMLTMEGFRADGKRFATGQMAMHQDRPDKYSWGASIAIVARLFCMAQGSLGIVTRCAVTLKLNPKYSQVLFFECKNANQAAMALRSFVSTEQPNEIFAVNKTYLAELLGEDKNASMAPWTVVLVNRGADEEELAYKKKDQSAIAKQLGGKVQTTIKGMRGAADRILDEIANPTGAALHQNGKEWTPIVSIATAEQVKASAKLFTASSGAIMMPLQAGGSFYYQPDLRYKAGEVDDARAKYVDVCEQMLEMGVTFPRPSALIAKQVAKKYPSNFKVLQQLKQAIDPKNIMNPGKLGL